MIMTAPRAAAITGAEEPSEHDVTIYGLEY
jgi:hypothetical protein